MDVTELVDLTLAGAAALLDRREVSAVDLLEATIAQIERTEPAVEAYVRVLTDTAREEARRADGELARRGQVRGPLHGIPVAVKDLCYTHDAPTEAGSRVLGGFVPPADGTVVRLLRNGGAVLVGKTTTHEFAYVEPPPTRNAWDQDYTPAGSSAGSAVALAVRSIFGAIGTDGGGSIRSPASLNGVVGLKPTCGRVSRTGVVPMSSTLDHVGPMTRTVEDCALMLGVVAGYDPLDIQSIDTPVDDFAADLDRGVEGLRLGLEVAHFADPRDPPIGRETVEAAAGEFERLGAVVVEVEIPLVDLVEAIFYPIIAVDTSAYHRRWIRDRADRYGQGTRIAVEWGELIPGTHYATAQRARTILRDAFRDTFRRHRLDALLTPSSGPAVPMSEASGDLFDFSLRLAAANLTGMPALSLPAGFTDDGLPLSFELYGRPFDERTLLRVAAAYEREHPWHRRRPPVAGD